jgi:hypothetical protein
MWHVRKCRISIAFTGTFLLRAEQLLKTRVSEDLKARLVDNPQYKAWMSAASAFFTVVNTEISNATPHELCLLSSDDKIFVPVLSAPVNYKSNLALLLCFAAKEDQVHAAFTSIIASVADFSIGTRGRKRWQYPAGVAGRHEAYKQNCIYNHAICCMSAANSEIC